MSALCPPIPTDRTHCDGSHAIFSGIASLTVLDVALASRFLELCCEVADRLVGLSQPLFEMSRLVGAMGELLRAAINLVYRVGVVPHVHAARPTRPPALLDVRHGSPRKKENEKDRSSGQCDDHE